MKYLLMQRAKWSAHYEVHEFETVTALSAYVAQNGMKTDETIVAQRIGVTLQICDWVAPVVIEEELAA